MMFDETRWRLSRSRWRVSRAIPLAALALGAAAGSLPGVQEEEERELGWSGTADVGFTLTEGNSRTSSLSLAAGVERELESQKWSLTGSFIRSTSDGEETANKGSAAGQYDFFPSERFFVFGAVRGGFNRPAGIDLRLQPSLGSGYVIARSGRVELSLDGGVSYIVESFENDSTDAALFGRIGQELTVGIGERTNLSQTFAYSPRAEDPGDYLLHAELAFATFFAEPVGLKVTVIEEFDSSPFVDDAGEAREKSDLTFITGLTFRF